MYKVSIENRKYLGSNRKILPYIKKVVEENCSEIASFFEPFAGIGIVSNMFNSEGCSIVINDNLFSNYVIYSAFFGSEHIDEEKLKNIVEIYNNLDGNNLEDNYFAINFSNTYFNRINCRKIDYIRQDIENMYDSKSINSREKCYLLTSLIYACDKIANICSHYDTYRKDAVLDKNLVLPVLDLPNRKVNLNNTILNLDANSIAGKISADLVYLDPPTSHRQYIDMYHFLENLACYKKPEVFGNSKKMEREYLKSAYSTSQARIYLDKLVSNLKAKYILFHYRKPKNNDKSSTISYRDLIDILSSRGAIKSFKLPVDSSSYDEMLILCSIDQKRIFEESLIPEDYDIGLVKSPINYVSGQYHQLNEILDVLPSKINCFVDLFAGGFNIGINVKAENIIYNDKDFYLVKLIQLINRYQYLDVISKIESLIAKYGLSNTYKNGHGFYKEKLSKFNQLGFEKMRSDFNKMINCDEKYFLLLTLSIFSYNNLIRFSKKGEYNSGVGNSDFNKIIRRNIKKFSLMLKQKNIVFYNRDFRDVEIDSLDCFVYIDPPYYFTKHQLENSTFKEDDELDLYSYMERLNLAGIKFAFSSCLNYKGKENSLLKAFIDKNKLNVHYLSKSKKNQTDVIVTNY